MQWRWIRKATSQDKAEMQEVADTLNELEAKEGEGRTYEVRRSKMYYLHCIEAPDMSYSLVKCTTCGGIRELDQGQIEFCTTCGADWEA